MKSKLSKLHNHFVNEDPITKMMFDAFPDDFVLYGGAIIDWWIGNPYTIDYDVALLNDRWEDGVEFLTSQRPNQNIWQFKEVIVPQKNYFATYREATGRPTKLSKGHLPWIVMLEQKAGYDIRFIPGNRKWEKPYIGISKLNRKENHVRTNHGYEYKDSGYTSGKNKISSEKRWQYAQDILSTVKTPTDVLDGLSGYHAVNMRDNPYRNVDMVKNPTDKDILSTTGQIMMNLTDLEFTLRVDKDKSEYFGID